MPRPVVPSNYSVDPGVFIDNYLVPDVTYRFNLGTSGDAIAEFSTDNVRDLTKSAHLLTGTTANSRAAIRPRSDVSAFPGLVNIGAGGWAVIPFWMQHIESQDGVNVAFYDGANSSRVNSGPNPLMTEQNYYLVDILRATAGITDWNANLDDYDVQLQHLNSGGSPSEIFVNGFLLKPRSKPVVIIMFDDGWLGVHTEAMPYMSARGIKGCIPVIDTAVEETDHMSIAQLQDAYNLGWDLNTHGNSRHIDLGTYDLIIAEVIKNRDFILAQGWNRGVYHYTYAGGGKLGNTGGISDQVLAATGMITGGMTSGGTFNTAFGIDNPYFIRRAGWNEESLAAGSFDEEFERVKRTGGVLLLYAHDIQTTVTAPSVHITIANFKSGIDQIVAARDAGEIDVMLLSEWWDGL